MMETSETKKKKICLLVPLLGPPVSLAFLNVEHCCYSPSQGMINRTPIVPDKVPPRAKPGAGAAKGDASLYPEYVDDPKGYFADNGRCIVDASLRRQYKIEEREMTEEEKMEFRNFQVFRLTIGVDRRNSNFQAMATSDFTSNQPFHHWLGTPFPLIEPFPHWCELLFGIRWYEHIICCVACLLHYQIMRSRPQLRYSMANWACQKYVSIVTFSASECTFGFCSGARLCGNYPNEYECYKFGVLETPERLREKAKKLGKTEKRTRKSG